MERRAATAVAPAAAPFEVSEPVTVVYRHYLPELARKPQAVRQIAPELLAELGEPWGSLWQLLAATHGQLEAVRILAKLLGTLEEHGEERLRPVLEAALAHQQAGVLNIPPPPPESIMVPEVVVELAVGNFVDADRDEGVKLHEPLGLRIFAKFAL
jgi:hypothetical protein